MRAILLLAIFLLGVEGAQNYTFNIQDYGADPSGKSDSTGYIQEAINLAQQIGGMVIVPPGNYLISSSLSISSSIRIEGMTPQTSVFISYLTAPGSYAMSITGATGLVVNNLGFKSLMAGQDCGLMSQNNFLVQFNNLQFTNCATAMWIQNTGNLDMYSINIWSPTVYGIRMASINGDAFLSNIHVNNANQQGIGLYLTNISGGKFTNSDFIGGAQGVYMDIDPSLPSPVNEWNQFLSVDCDTVSNDPWHIVSAHGLQMSECWSGTFPNGCGIWLGSDVSQVSIVNHQFQDGEYGIGNNANGVTVTAGIMANVGTPVSSSVSGQPVISNLGVY